MAIRLATRSRRSRRIQETIWLIPALVFVLARSAFAAEIPSNPETKQSPRTSAIVEGAFLLRMDEDADSYSDGSSMFTADFGYITRRNDDYSTGGTMFLSGDEEFARIGLKGRLRRHFGDHLAVDLAPGVIVVGTGDRLSRNLFPGGVGVATITFYRTLCVTGQVEAIQLRKSRDIGPGMAKFWNETDWGWYLGATLSGKAGIPAGILALIGMQVLRWGRALAS